MTERVRTILTESRDMVRPFGGRASVSHIEHQWSKMRKGLGISSADDPEFVIHALRHTCASRLAASGQDAFRIQKWMGHKTIITTQKYVTLFADDLRPLADALDAQGGR